MKQWNRDRILKFLDDTCHHWQGAWRIERQGEWNQRVSGTQKAGKTLVTGCFSGGEVAAVMTIAMRDIARIRRGRMRPNPVVMRLTTRQRCCCHALQGKADQDRDQDEQSA